MSRYQRVSHDYPWLCTYFGADIGQGVKANQAIEKTVLFGHFLYKTDHFTKTGASGQT
jgi:hypothetical protein